MKVSIVPPERVHECWDEVAPLLQPAVDRSGGRFLMEDVYHLVATGENHLWVVFEDGVIVACCTTAFTEYPRKRMLTGQFLGGSQMTEWVPKLDAVLQQWGTDHGCSGIELTGRKGWLRVLDKIGWDITFYIMEKSYGQR